VAADHAGRSHDRRIQPEEKTGLHAIPTTTAHYADAFVPVQRRIGAGGQGLQIAFSALDSGRLGFAASFHRAPVA
jgi:alkylation response protein AidB-like acyl-CoA dehydrogenase